MASSRLPTFPGNGHPLPGVQEESAQFHLTWIVEEVSRTLNLCEAGAKEKGFSDPANFTRDGLLEVLRAGDAKSR
ncbi:MAG: hypothetical protein ACKVYV_06170 [Limisphaerales bacterium]